MRKILVSFLIAFNTISLNVQAKEVIKKADIETISRTYKNSIQKDFSSFIKNIYSDTKNQSLKESIDLYLKNEIVSENDYLNIYRLLGTYSGIKYKDQMIETLGKLVEIATDKKEDIPQYKNPEIIRFGEAIKSLAEKFGLEYKNIDNRVFEVILQGKGKDYFGVYTHADVVPADPTKWVLADGTKLNPYKMSIIGDKIYGRGTEDDKCSIVSALYAMKTIKENNLKLNRSIKLLIETTEETSGEGIEYYKSKYDVPKYNIVLDSTYPLVTAEKGSGIISAKYQIKNVEEIGDEIIGLTGGLAYNQIPSTSVITIKSFDPKRLNNLINSKIDSYIKNNGNNFKINSNLEGDLIKVSVNGKSGHSAGPQNTVNPVSRACDFLYSLKDQITFKSNAFKNAAFFIAENFGLDYNGNKLDIGYKDDFMGVMTASPTLVKVKNGELEVAVNVRSPRGKEPEVLKKEIINKLDSYQKKTNNPFKLEVKIGKYMYRDLKGNWINTLLTTFSDVTGKEAKPLSISGTTTAKQLPNGVCFGPAMPGEAYTGHSDNEFKKIDNFIFDITMFTEMFMRISNLNEME